MPLWRIFANPSTFSPSQRSGIAQAITDLYTGVGLPAFYVNVIFINVDEDSLWIGGEQKPNFVRIVIEQIARTMPDPGTEQGRAHRKGWMDMINAALKPFITDRPELEWEHHISETPRDLWRVNGLDAPPQNSEAEKSWKEKNVAHPWQ